MALIDNFKNGAPAPIWRLSGDTGVLTDGAGEFVLGFTGDERAAQLNSLDLRGGGELTFDLLLGGGSATPFGIFEAIDPGEDIIVAVHPTVPGEITFIGPESEQFVSLAEIGIEDVAQTDRFISFSVPIPADLIIRDFAIIQFRQPIFTDDGFDGWALDNVAFTRDARTRFEAVEHVVQEGDAFGTTVQLVVRRGGFFNQELTVDYEVEAISTADGARPASADDFTVNPFVTETLTFAKDQQTQIIGFEIAGDTNIEFAEAFKVTLSNPSLGGLGESVAVVTIENDDFISSDVPGDQVLGTAGSDQVQSGADGQQLFGRDGDDQLSSLHRNVSLFGEGGDDILTGGQFADRLEGGADADRLDGGLGGDVMNGGAGDDVILGGFGNDQIDGGDGSDTVDYSGFGGAVFVDLAPAPLQTNGGGGNDVVLNVENAIGGDFNDELRGANDASRLFGGDGNDLLLGRGGDDVLQGETGRDRLLGGADNDRLIGGGEADRLFGQTGDDQLFGGFGDDLLSGGDAADILDGGFGRDFLTGGAGADVFAFDDVAETPVGCARDIIRDFEQGVDVIDLSGIDAIAGGPDNAFIFLNSGGFNGNAGVLRATSTAFHTVVRGDVDGDRVQDFEINMDGVFNLQSSDFIL